MTSFIYRKIGQPLIQELSEKIIDSAESVVLIAPRYGGKRYLMNRLYDLLSEQSQFHVLRPHVSLQTSVSNDRDFRDWFSKVVRGGQNRYPDSAGAADDPFTALDQLVERSPRRVVLLVSNVDSFSQLMARNLLLKVRTLVESRKLVAVLSGEDVFQKLVYGPGSEFNCAHQYFLQAYDRELFIEETIKYRDAVNLSFVNDEEAVNHLYEISGGHLSIMKTLLRDVVEMRLRQHRPLVDPIDLSEIPDSINPDLLRQPPRVINNEPRCWEDLKQLLRSDVTSISWISNAPGPLELAGVVVRDGWRIRIASPILKNFLKKYYNNKRLGDLYLRNGQSETAFAYYEQLSDEERVRPSTTDDRREAAFTVKILSAALHELADKGVDEIRKLFFKTCRYVLGFHEVACLELNEKWEMVTIPGCHVNDEVISKLNQLLPATEPRVGPFEIPGGLGHYVMSAIIPTVRYDQFRAVVISDYTANRTISKEREILAVQLLDHFVKASQKATEIETARQHLRMRDRYIEIVNSIFDGLGSRTRDVEHVIRSAAQSLRKLEYRRVSFCLVDPQRKRIKGVLDESDDKLVDVAKMTDYPLDDPKADIQTYVISTGEPRRVPDAAREPLANPEVVRLARLKAFAVVPLLSRSNEAIGTVHVERKDDLIPSKEEVDDLLLFGRQLAIAIGQSERVNLLQSSLDKLVSSLIIVDPTLKLRYANQGAAVLLGVEKGWQNGREAVRLTNNGVGEEAIKMIQESLQGHRQERHIERVINSNERHNLEVLSDAISSVIDGREQTVGAFLRIRELDYVYRMFEAFSLLADATDTHSALKLLLKAAQTLGFESGRLYLVDQEKPTFLVSRDSFGFKDPRDEEYFNSGGIRQERRFTPGKESWTCLDKGAPLVFYYSPDLPDGDEHITKKGQAAIVVNVPRLQAELNKKPGDMWVDIPLRTQDGRPLGKFTLDWHEDRWPREFALLEVLVEMVAHVFDAFMERERKEETLEIVRVQAAQKVMAIMAHNIGTQLAALPVLQSRYKQREKNLPELKELNRRFGQINEELSTVIDRAKERLAVISPKISQLDLASSLTAALQSYLPRQNYEVVCYRKPFELQADGHLLNQALVELIQNSKNAADAVELLKIEITLKSDVTPEGEQAQIIYRDNGPGVPDEFKEKIFEDSFSRRPGRKPGTGLGMGYVRRVAIAHGGNIVERGKAGEGATFVITLPLKRMNEQEEESNVSHSGR